MTDRSKQQPGSFDGKLTDEEWLRVLAEKWNVPAIDLDVYEIPDEALALIPREMIARRKVFPVNVAQDGEEEILILAMADPADAEAREEASFIADRRIVVVATTDECIDRALARHQDRL